MTIIKTQPTRSQQPTLTPRSTTRKTLRRLRMLLLAGALAVLVTSSVAFQGVDQTADLLHVRGVPAVLEVVEAKSALVEADAAAVHSFETGEARLAGPGVQYQSQIAVASRSLAQAAEDNLAGSTGSQRIQLVWGLVIAYMGLIEQADAQYRQHQDTTLGMIHLWYASRLLHNGILVQLDLLREDQERALTARLSSGWMNPLATVVWAVPIGVLLVLLVTTQVYLRCRFRRTLNLPLVAGTVLVLLFAAGGAFSLTTQDRLKAVQGGVSELRDAWEAQTKATDLRGQQALARLVAQQCPDSGSVCGETVRTFVSALAGASAPDGGRAGERPTARIALVNKQSLAAANTRRIEFFMPVAAVVIGALVLLALQPRIEEYRYRQL